MQPVEEFSFKVPSQQEANPLPRGFSLLLNVLLALIFIGLATILAIGVVIGIVLVG